MKKTTRKHSSSTETLRALTPDGRLNKSWYIAITAASVVGLAACGSVSVTTPDAPQPDGSAVVIDAPPGSVPARTKYDVAYVNDVTIGPNITSIRSFVLVVNTGTAPLKLSTASVVAFSDDSTDFDCEVTKNGATTTMLDPGHAAGQLNPDATGKIVASGLVPEPIQDNVLDFTMAFPRIAISGVTVHAQTVLQIDGANIVLPFTIKLASSGFVQFNSAGRVNSLQ